MDRCAVMCSYIDGHKSHSNAVMHTAFVEHGPCAATGILVMVAQLKLCTALHHAMMACTSPAS
jgi:hypothetical protein